MYVKGEDRQENDAEHSYQVAMLAWYLVESKKLPLDSSLVVKYALVHDLVEAYAGDTYIFDEESAKTKHVREAEAQKKLGTVFVEFPEMNSLIQKYEDRQDEESKFVYALDKLIPMFNNYLDDGRTWKRNNITLEMLINQKQGKVEVSPECKKYFDELVSVLNERPDLFISNN
jgi:putative hydrolase of HD superfamily